MLFNFCTPIGPNLFIAMLAGTLTLAGCNRNVPEKGGAGKSDSPIGKADSATASSKKAATVSVTGTDSVSGILTLLDTVEARLRRGDTVGLVRLMVDDSAYRRHIYPTSSAYDSISEDAFRFVMGMHKANSAKGLRRVLAEMQKQDSVPIVILREIDSLPVPGGMLYQTRQGTGVRPFGTALRVGTVCRIATFGHPGSSR